MYNLNLTFSMATIKPMALIETMSGGVCMHSDVYFRTNKRSGKVTSGKLCNPYDGPASEDQLAVRTKFAAVAALTKTIANATESDTANFAKKQAYVKSYAENPTYGGTLYNWIFKHEYATYSAE